MSLENWIHFNPNILVAGRITHYVNPSLSEEVNLIKNIIYLRKKKLN